MNEDTAIDVVLEGGPAGIPAEQRSTRVAAGQRRVKIAYSGGYEHFEDAGAGDTPAVFRWTMRTRIAE